MAGAGEATQVGVGHQRAVGLPAQHKPIARPAHDDLVERDFTAPSPNRLWLPDAIEHWTGEGKLHLCAVKDVYSNRIVATPSTPG